MITLCSNRSCRWFSHAGIGLNAFMEDFHFPPFLVDCFKSLFVCVYIIADQIECACTSIFVCKDLMMEKNRKYQSFHPSLYRCFWPCDAINTRKTTLCFTFYLLVRLIACFLTLKWNIFPSYDGYTEYSRQRKTSYQLKHSAITWTMLFVSRN